MKVPNSNKFFSPLFSIIIPVYNVAPYLKESLESLFSQNLENTEIILIDDGSNDGSEKICDEYKDSIPNLKIVHQINSGVASARNLGLYLAKGEYLLWLDPDDKLLPEWGRTLQEVVIKNHPDMVIFDYEMQYGNNHTSVIYNRKSGLIEVKQVLTDLARDHRLTSVLWNKVISRKCFGTLLFDTKLRCMEDYDLVYRIIAKTEKIIYIPKVLYSYQIRNDGLVRSPDLTIAYQCYLESVKRQHNFSQIDYSDSILGVLLQAKGFCCKYYRSHTPQAFKRQYLECQTILKQNAMIVLADKELDYTEKIKYLLIPYKLVGRFYAIREIRNQPQ